MRTPSQPTSIAALTEKDIEAIVAMVCNSSSAMPSIWGVGCRAHACFSSVTTSQSLQCYSGHTGHIGKGHMICNTATSQCHQRSEVPRTMYHRANWDNLKSLLCILEIESESYCLCRRLAAAGTRLPLTWILTWKPVAACWPGFWWTCGSGQALLPRFHWLASSCKGGHLVMTCYVNHTKSSSRKASPLSMHWTIIYDALSRYTVLSSVITPPGGDSGYLAQDLQCCAEVYRLVPGASALFSPSRLLSSGTMETQARAFDIIQSLALLVTAPAKSIADCGPALQEWTRLLLFDLLHTLAQVRGRGMCHASGHCEPCLAPSHAPSPKLHACRCCTSGKLCGMKVWMSPILLSFLRLRA